MYGKHFGGVGWPPGKEQIPVAAGAPAQFLLLLRGGGLAPPGRIPAAAVGVDGPSSQISAAVAWDGWPTPG